MTMIPIDGTEDNDYISDMDELYEDNVIKAGGGDDIVHAYSGNDVVFCGAMNDIAYGFMGMDILYGEEGGDELHGGEGNDWLVGGSGHDWLYGDEDNDYLIGGSGFDELDGGSGTDTASYSDSSSGVTVNLAKGIGQGGEAEGDTLISIEDVHGSGHDDILIGNQFANELHGGSGIDHLSGGGENDKLFGGYGGDTLQGDDGDDELWGGTGNDMLIGGSGADYLGGGDGIDTAVYQGSAQAVVVSLMSHSGLFGDAQDDTLWGIENLVGSAHGDALVGDDGVNMLAGSGGNDSLQSLNDDDTLFGGEGNDTLDGGKGADKMDGGLDDDTYIVDHADDEALEAVGEGDDVVQTSVSYQLGYGSEIEVLETTDVKDSTALDLIGNEFDNEIIGNAGANSLIGGLGRDVLTGNGGADSFIWTLVTETGTDLADADVVTDFVAGEDVLSFLAIDANETNGIGNDQFEFIGDAWTTPFTAPGQINYTFDRHNTYIFLNTDGDADAEGMIRVQGSHTVDAGWFVL
jgi:Ca2+-binding RTX toxin-like protein